MREKKDELRNNYSLEVVVAGEGIAVGTSHGDNGLAEIFILPACV